MRGRGNLLARTQMQFGERVRDLRQKNCLTQQELADRLNVSSTYISKVENEKLHFGDYPSEKFIHKLADALKADEDELLVLTDRVPKAIRKRVRERPEAFRAIADCDDITLDKLLGEINQLRDDKEERSRVKKRNGAKHER